MARFYFPIRAYASYQERDQWTFYNATLLRNDNMQDQNTLPSRLLSNDEIARLKAEAYERHALKSNDTIAHEIERLKSATRLNRKQRRKKLAELRRKVDKEKRSG